MTYLFSIKTAIAWFPFLAFLFTIPFLIRQYHRYGSVNFFRILIVYSFIFYLLTLYFLVILPLPSKNEVVYDPNVIRLVPFGFVGDFIRESSFVWNDPSTYLKAFLSPSCYTVIFNFFMTIPFGMYLRYYFQWTFGKTVWASFLLSLFFEITQLSGLYGIYSYPYRVFDVDDLILNTLGGMMGYFLFGFFIRFLPTRTEIDEISYQKGQVVTGFRRILSFGLDSISYLLLCIFFCIFWDSMYVFLLAFCFYFLFIPIIFGGTLWSKFLGIKIVFSYSSLTHLLSYNLFLFFYYYLLPFFILSFATRILKQYSLLATLFPYFYLVIFFCISFFYLGNCLVILRRRKNFYDKLFSVSYVSTTRKQNRLDNEIKKEYNIFERRMVMREVKLNRIYKHFKGDYYLAVCIAHDSETLEDMVVYQHLYGDGGYCVRPVASFLSEVDHEKYPDVTQKYRFELQEIESVADKFRKE